MRTAKSIFAVFLKKIVDMADFFLGKESQVAMMRQGSPPPERGHVGWCTPKAERSGWRKKNLEYFVSNLVYGGHLRDRVHLAEIRPRRQQHPNERGVVPRPPLLDGDGQDPPWHPVPSFFDVIMVQAESGVADGVGKQAELPGAEGREGSCLDWEKMLLIFREIILPYNVHFHRDLSNF